MIGSLFKTVSTSGGGAGADESSLMIGSFIQDGIYIRRRSRSDESSFMIGFDSKRF